MEVEVDALALVDFSCRELVWNRNRVDRMNSCSSRWRFTEVEAVVLWRSVLYNKDEPVAVAGRRRSSGMISASYNFRYAEDEDSLLDNMNR